MHRMILKPIETQWNSELEDKWCVPICIYKYIVQINTYNLYNYTTVIN